MLVPTTATVRLVLAASGLANVTASITLSRGAKIPEDGAIDEATRAASRTVPLMVAPAAGLDGAVGSGAAHWPHATFTKDTTTIVATTFATRIFWPPKR